MPVFSLLQTLLFSTFPPPAAPHVWKRERVANGETTELSQYDFGLGILIQKQQCHWKWSEVFSTSVNDQEGYEDLFKFSFKDWEWNNPHYRLLCVYVCSCSVMSDSLQPLWTVAHQAPLSLRFPRQEYWSGLPFPTPEDLPKPVI